MHRTLATALALLLSTPAAMACGGQSTAAAEQAAPARVLLAQATTPSTQPSDTSGARPARGPQSEVSTGGNSAPPATTNQSTASTNQPPTVKQMNREAADKLSKEGK